MGCRRKEDCLGFLELGLKPRGARNYRSKAAQLGFAGEVDLEVGFG